MICERCNKKVDALRWAKGCTSDSGFQLAVCPACLRQWKNICSKYQEPK